MQIEERSLEQDTTATAQGWFAPFAMLIAWLAHLFDQIAKMKRIRHTTKFKANWRDHFPRLVQCEWHREQILAYGAAQLLAGQPLDLTDMGLYLDPPDNYGGPCPKTPQEMNRRFLAIARWNADPEAAIRKHAARIAKRAGIDISGCPLRPAAQATSPALRAEEENTCACGLCVSSSSATRRGRWRACTCTRDGGGSRSSRGPPTFPAPFTTRYPPQRPTAENAPARPTLTSAPISTTYAAPTGAAHMKPSKPA